MTLLTNLNSDDAGAHNDNEEQEAKWKECESPTQKIRNLTRRLGQKLVTIGKAGFISVDF